MSDAAAPSDAVAVQVRAAYDDFAGFYDDFTSHHDDDAWTEALEEAARAAGLHGDRLLDVACGTGRSFLPLLARGYRVTACDISPAMAERARAKAGPGARVLVCDMRALPVLGAFDLVWCLSDALSYLPTTTDVDAMLTGAVRNLAPGGVVLLELPTLATCRTLYASLVVRPGRERVLVLDGHGDAELPPGGRSEVWIERLWREPSGWWRRTRTVHRHRHHPLEELAPALERAGLRLHRALGSDRAGRLHDPLDELAHVKAIVVATLRG